MDKTSRLSRDQFEFVYESQGTTFLFQDVVATTYQLWHSVIFSKGDRIEVYEHKDALNEGRRMGLQRTPQETQGVISRLNGYIDDMVALEQRISGKVFEKGDAQAVFGLLEDICHEYSYFDYCFWDDVFKEAEHTPALKETVELVQNYKNVIREKINHIFVEPTGGLEMTAIKAAQLSGVPLTDIVWYRHEEILRLLDGVRVQATDLQERRDMFAFYIPDDLRVRLYQGENAKVLVSELSRDVSDQQILKGKTAHGSGTVTGKVTIITRNYADVEAMRKEMAAMEQGNILISETTEPTMLEAMKKASAIVTDVGGMLSHAAITARELNIPCVVGTSIASKLLKDGDLVTVDVTAGTVTKLQNS